MTILRLISIFVSVFLAMPTTANAESLADVVRQAVATNPSITAAQASRSASLSVLDQAKGRFLPELDVSADIGREKIDRPQGLVPDLNDTWRERRQVTISFRQFFLMVLIA